MVYIKSVCILNNLEQQISHLIKKDYLQISRIKHIDFQIFYADLPSKGCSCKEIGCFGMDYKWQRKNGIRS